MGSFIVSFSENETNLLSETYFWSFKYISDASALFVRAQAKHSSSNEAQLVYF